MNYEMILSGDAGLAGIQWAFKSRHIRNLLRKELLRMMRPGSRIEPLRITRAKYKPRLRLLSYYTLTVHDPETGESRSVPLEVNWGKPVNFAAQNPAGTESLAMQEEARQRRLLAPFTKLQQEIEGQGIRLRLWPLDPDFPQLVRLGDPTYAPHLFQTANIPLKLERGDFVNNIPIRYRPGERHVLRYQVESDKNHAYPERLYAKLYRDAGAAARSYRIANRIVDWLDESLSGFTGVRPAGMSSEDAVILYHHAEGTKLSQHLHRSPAWLSCQLRLVGTALNRLHHGPEALTLELEENPLEREIKAITRASEPIQTLLPDVGAKILRLLDNARELYARLPQEAPAFTHSDFKADHLLVSPDGITLIDFDTCALADPALDLGKFLADLEWWYESAHSSGMAQAQQEFLTGYNNVGNNGRLARAQIYKSLILTKITIRRARIYEPDWAALTSQMIQRAENILLNRSMDQRVRTL